MRQATLDDLIAADTADGYGDWGFDYEQAMARVAALREPLETLTGHHFEQDTQVQDASYFTELFAAVPAPTPTPGGGMGYQCFARLPFSFFGDFFTIYGYSSVRPLTDETRLRMAELVTEHGFLYVPREILDLPHPTRRCWWIRYFDYL